MKTGRVQIYTGPNLYYYQGQRFKALQERDGIMEETVFHKCFVRPWLKRLERELSIIWAGLGWPLLST